MNFIFVLGDLKKTNCLIYINLFNILHRHTNIWYINVLSKLQNLISSKLTRLYLDCERVKGI